MTRGRRPAAPARHRRVCADGARADGARAVGARAAWLAVARAVGALAARLAVGALAAPLVVGALAGPLVVGALAAALALAAPAEAVAQTRPLAPSEATTRPAWLRGSAPSGWRGQAGLARSVGTGLRQSAPLGRGATRAGAEAYVQPGAGAFYLSWLEAEAAAPEAVRGAFDRLRERRLASSPEARSTEELRYEERVADGVAIAELEWRHLSNETLSAARAFAWLTTAGAPRLAVAECVLSTRGGQVPAEVDAACRAALGSVAIAVAPAERGSVAALGQARVPVEAERDSIDPGVLAPGAALDPAAVDRAGRASPPTLGPAPGEPGRVLYRGPTPEPDTSRRWLVMIGAAIVIAAFYLTIRTRRSQPSDNDEAGPRAGPDSPDEPDVGPEKTP